jgi:hypothetical protein
MPASLPATGRFSDLFTDPQARPTSLLDTVAGAVKIVATLSPGFAACGTDAPATATTGRARETCQTRELASLDRRGFVGVWATPAGPGRAFTVVDDRFRLWDGD